MHIKDDPFTFYFETRAIRDQCLFNVTDELIHAAFGTKNQLVVFNSNLGTILFNNPHIADDVSNFGAGPLDVSRFPR